MKISFLQRTCVCVFTGPVLPHVFAATQHTAYSGAGVAVTQTGRLPSVFGERLHCPGAFYKQARGSG